MDLTVVNAVGLGDAWFQCLQKALLEGRTYLIQQGSFEGTHRKEIPLVAVTINNPGIRPLSPSVPDGVPAPTTDEVIEEYMLYLMTADKKPNEEYTYGEDLAPQIEEVIRRYKLSYDTNQMCMSVGSPSSIYLKDPQCMRLVDTRVQDNALHFIVYFRSWDLWGGFPTNLGGLQLLKEYVAKEIGVDDGSLVAFSKGLHLYEHCWDLAKMVLRMELGPE
ncbi:MAG: thymidylate synthase [Dehalococcoidia bacterium]|nr:thymidylate synthase [Dehalococcoidia bacterium]